MIDSYMLEGAKSIGAGAATIASAGAFLLGSQAEVEKAIQSFSEALGFQGLNPLLFFLIAFLYWLYLMIALWVHRADQKRMCNIAMEKKVNVEHRFGWRGVV